MRTNAWPLTLLLVGLVTGSALGDEKDAIDLVQRAIKAHGGEPALRKALVCIRTETGTRFKGGEPELKFTSEVTRELPERVRLQIDVPDKKLQTIAVLNGEKGWIRAGGMASEMARPLVMEIREDAIVWWQSTLIPLIRGPFVLSTIPGVSVDGEETDGIKVEGRGYVDTKMYFFKRTGLLARIERRAADNGIAGQKEFLFSAYKNFDGVRLPSKEVQVFNGKKTVEIQVTGYKFLTRVEDGTFDKP